MNRLYKFVHLPGAEQRLLVKAAILLGTIRLGLWLLPFRTLQHLLLRAIEAPIRLREANKASVERLAWAVTQASRHVPMATCLTQALTAQVLLTRRGHPAQLHVGFARSEEGSLQGHAWLESRGRVVVGDGELSRYTRLPSIR